MTLLTLSALLLVPIAASFLLYWKAIAVDGGWLATADDRAMLEHARQDLGLGGLLELHGLHFVPAMRLTFLVMLALFGTAWTPYGVVLVLSHGLLGAAVAAAVYWFGRSWPAALGIALPLTVSWSLSSGVLTSFVYVNIYLLIGVLVLVPVLVDWYLSTSSKTALTLLFLALSWCIFTLLSGLLAYIAAAIFYAGLKYTSDETGAGLRGVFTVTRRDLGMLGVVVVSLGLYGLAYGSELYAVGGRLPIEMGFCEETMHLSPLDRYLYVLAFGYFGFVSNGGFGFLPTDEIDWHRFIYGGVTVVLLVASTITVFLARWLSPSVRSTAAVVAGFVLLAMIAAGMVTSGRSCIQLWHMRYNAYALIFVGCAIGVLIGQIVKASPRRVSMVISAALLALSLFVTYQNVQVVLASPWMVERAPGFLGP